MIIEVRCGAKDGSCGRLLMTVTDESGSWVFEPVRQLGPPVGPVREDGTLRSMYPTLRCQKDGKRPLLDVLPLLLGTEPETFSSRIPGGKVTFI